MQNHQIHDHLHSAIDMDDADAVRDWLKQKPEDLHVLSDYKGHYNGKKVSPLELSVIRRSLKIVKVLIEAGADPDQKNEYSGDTPIHLALFYGQLEMAHYLISQSKKINTQNNEGQGYLHKAKKIESVELLIRCGIDIHQQDQSFKTALHYAAARGLVDVVQRLTALGADPLIKSRMGSSALDMAIVNNQFKVVECLWNFPGIPQKKENIEFYLEIAKEQHDQSPLIQFLEGALLAKHEIESLTRAVPGLTEKNDASESPSESLLAPAKGRL